MARKPARNKSSASRHNEGYDWQGDSSGALRRIMKFGFIAALWAMIVGGAVVAWYASELPHIVQSTAFQRKWSVTIKAEDGSVIARYGDLKGQSLSYRELPKDLVHAVVAIEDRRFYKHIGIDLVGLVRAMAVNVKEGEVVQGGSTLTQQLAKNLFLTQDRTFKRKVQEALLALWLEHQLTKDEIISAYLNRVYMGSGAYGVEAAAQVYYSKHAQDLNLEESATLAGLLKAPSRYSPIASPQAARSRARIVMKAMLDEHYITQKQYDKVADSTPVPQHKPMAGDTQRYFSDWIMSELVDMIGAPDRDLVVETTMWPEAQKAAEAALTAALDQNGEKKHVSQGAAVMMDIDGAVHVMVGGRDYNKSQFNRAAQSLRPPGSSFKPVVYLTALENGWHPTDMINDTPVSIGHYHPANFKNEYYGMVPLHFALSRSLNSAAIQLAQNVGVDKIARMAYNLGIHSDLERNLSMALGSNGVPVLEMVTAYATFANAGVGVDPYAIIDIKDVNGQVIYQHHAKAMPLQVVSPNSAQELASMMRETIDEGTGQRAQIPWLAAGKTGTSQDYRDAWFMGFSGRFATGVWVGNDDNSPMKAVTGGSIPAGIWRDIMMATYRVAQAQGIATQGPIQFYNLETPLGAGAPTVGNDLDQQYVGNGAYVPPPPPGQMQQQPANNNATRTFGDVIHDIFSF